MAYLKSTFLANVEEAVKAIERSVLNSGFTAEKICEIRRKVGDYDYYALGFEKYFMRNKSRTGLTVIILGNSEKCFADAISTGGSDNTFLRFSWGAEEDMVDCVKSAVKSLDANAFFEENS